MRFLLILLVFCSQLICDRHMSSFTKDVILLLVNESNDIENKSGNVYLSSWADSTHYYLKVQFNESDPELSDNTGNLSINYLTSESNLFFKTKKCVSDPDLDDMKFIQICLYKDKTFCPMFSYYLSPQEDISPIYRLIKSHRIKSTVSKGDLDYIYPAYLIENPPEFKAGLDSLNALIQKNISTKNDTLGQVLVNLVIDSEGNAEVGEIINKSGDPVIYEYASTIAETVVREPFIPAKHRGHIVNSYYTLCFRL